MSESEVFCISCVEIDDDCEIMPEELEAMYTQLEKEGTLPELEWKCPGRKKLASPALPDEIPLSDAVDKESENAQVNKEFDFMDETPLTTTQMRVRTPNATPKKKKTTNFAGVLDTMKKHGRFLPSSGAPSGKREAPTSESS